MIDYSLDKITSQIQRIANRLDSNRGIKAELIYKPEDIDRILNLGDTENHADFSSIKEDERIIETFINYLERENLAKKICGKTTRTNFILTPKGYTFKKYGGFTALYKAEKKNILHKKLWDLLGWVLIIIGTIASTIVGALISKYLS